jgi:hypothetical protein
VNDRLRFVKTKTDKIDKDVNGQGAWFYARHGLLEPNNHPGGIGDYQRALVLWLRDNNDESVFVDKNAPLNELFFKDGAEIKVPKDECSIACIVDTYVKHSDLHGGTVHVHLPRNGLSKAEWAVTEQIPPYKIHSDTDTGTPGDMATLSVECDGTKIHTDDEIIFDIYKKGAVPNRVNRINGGTGTKKANEPKVGWDWYYRYEDKDYPAAESAPRPVYFFEAFSNCMDVVTSGKEFTTAWVRLDDAKLQRLESDVQIGMQNQTQTQYVIKKLKDLFHNKTNVLARIIYDHLGDLDDDSQEYLKGFPDPKQQIQDILDNITVYMGITPAIMGPAFENAGLPPDRFLDALSIGDNIYVREFKIPPVFASGHQAEAAFLGHEAIHSMQARAFKTTAGGRERKARFITFCANNAYTVGTNRYEKAAYEFGGGAPDGFYPSQSSTPPQILLASGISDYWS